MAVATVAEAMWGNLLRFSAVLAAWLALASAAQAAGPDLVIGATEDAVRSTTLVDAKAQMDLLALAGFRGVRITQIWASGERAVSPDDVTTLENVVAAAKLANVTVLTSVMNFGSRTTPLTETDQSDFAAYAANVVEQVPELRTLIIGNEPNLNRYWLPQFNVDGTDAAAPAYEALLARTYDAVKAVDSGVTVLGGAVSPRGGDIPNGIRPTHSPTVFIQDMGQAVRDSGRTTPIMDGFAFHPYEDNSSVAPVSGTHPNSTTIALADYDKLVALLGAAFGDYTIPLWYDEFGVESQIPLAKQSFYINAEVAATKPVDEATQAEYYRQAVQLAFCQPNVRGLFLFHAFDERDLTGWQSGLYYADDTPKTSLNAVRLAMEESRRGVVAQCDDALHLAVHPKVVQRGAVLTLTCDLDCTYVAQLYRLPGHLLVSRRGRAIGGEPSTLPLRAPKTKGSYRLRLSAIAAVNPGKAATVLLNVRHG
jgi:hypothetical protein